MKKFKFRFSSFGMSKKLVIIFVFMLIIPITISAIVSYNYYRESIEQNTADYVSQTSMEVLNKIEDYIDDMRMITKIPMYSSELQSYLASPEKGIEKDIRIDFYIRLMSEMKKGTNAVYIFDNYGNSFYHNSLGSNEEAATHYDKLKQIARNQSGSAVLINTQAVKTDSGKTKYILTMVRDIIDLTTYQPIGFVAVETDLSTVEAYFKHLDQITGGKTIIVDEQNSVIFDSAYENISSNWRDKESIEKSPNASGNFHIEKNGEQYYSIYLSSQKLGWKVYVYVKTKELFSKANKIRNSTMIVTSVILLVTLLSSILISWAFTKPLRVLTGLMKKVQEGDFMVSFPVRFLDEVGILGVNFNRMIKKIVELINDVQVASFRKQEAEMEALQAQINPHFIYNTLETLRMKALINEDREVSEMALFLGKLLRYSIIKSGEIVTVKQELEHLTNYIKLQNYRFKNRYHLTIAIDPELEKYAMIKLVFQPIVENAIFHGLEKRSGQGTITISSKMEGEYYYVLFEDDGVGISPEQVKKLNSRIQLGNVAPNDKGDTGNGIGLHNVNERIKLHYGTKYGLTIESELDKGVIVFLKLPSVKSHVLLK
ncbi:sensor histidine kinase [Cohnella abietis]|uniref:histidine kinase n=1 Tax=Cohnella abietis TaxID=2507935 RepID=A0A3T1D1N0_9BACL|nr:sensor histidine kinase [Cohnella abietis]BBI31958.1 sensor histidine kinase YesM [Cohnella abietis]